MRTRYDDYHAADIDWLSEIPKHWEVLPLRSLSTGAENSFVDGDWIESRYITDNGIRLVQTGNIGVGRYKEQGFRFISEATFDELSCTEVMPGDILICRLADPVGRACRAPNLDAPMITSVDVCILSPNEFNDPDYFVYLLSSPDYLSHMEAQCRGGTRNRVSRKFLGRVRVPRPPLTEQQAIAAFLDRETGKIDELLEEQRRLIALLKEKRQAVISHAVTKGLDPTAPLKPSGIDWLGDIPAHWEVTQLKRLAQDGTSITYGIVQAGPMLEEGIPYIRTGDMSGDVLPSAGYPLTSHEIEAAFERSRVFPGDLVIAIRATIGKVLPVPRDLPMANLTQGTAKFSPGEGVLRDFIKHAISADCSQYYFSLHSKGATFKEITLDALRRLPIVLPPLDEQLKLADFLAAELARFTTLTAEATRAIALLQERRAALISAAVTGKIDVRDALSNDEEAA